MPRADPELTRRLATFVGKPLVPLSLRWPDSANWLWRSEEISPQLYKLARTAPDDDRFWAGMRDLFGFDRWQHPEAVTRVAGALPPRLPMAPLPMTFLSRFQGAPLWSLPWRQAVPPVLCREFAARLGQQLGLLHREPVPGWGHPASGYLTLDAWPERARRFVEAHPMAPDTATLALDWPRPSRAVWCLPDLRSDQFLRGATDWFWSDWEALVWAPVEFDLCLVELLFADTSHCHAFLDNYRRYARLPSLEPFRPGMRVVALMMGLHGEGAEAWILNHPEWLKG